jgi:hypothetical protein
MNLGQRLHHKAGMKVIDKVPNPINRVIPRAIGILIFQNEIQISLRDFPVAVVVQDLRSARQ